MTKVVKLNKNNRDRLKSIREDSIDRNLNYLMDKVEGEMPFVRYTDMMTSVNLHDNTVERLDSFRISNGEARDNIITRMIIAYDNLEEEIQEFFIPFRLTSTLNRKLQLCCMLELNSLKIVFDEGYGVYGEALSNIYIVNGEDLSVEYKSWIDMLNWEDIRNIVQENAQEFKTIKMAASYLEINYL